MTSLSRYVGGLENQINFTYNGYQLTSTQDSLGRREFKYDSNGNMIFDGRKNLHYAYNCLNLLEKVIGPDSAEMASYVYLADGIKIEATDAQQTGYAYLGSLTYQRTASGYQLEGTDFTGGRILKTSGDYETFYYITDYQHSVRAILHEEGFVTEINDYLPFGTRCNTVNYAQSSNRYLFNGKEHQYFANLDLLDYGARMYDPVLGRWLSTDPAMQLMNPYLFCGNNPTVFFDKDGRLFWLLIALGATIGGYLGGSAANDNWNPIQWDWSSGKTWGGILGGALQGAVGGASLVYGLSAIPGTTIFGKSQISTLGYIFRGTSLALSSIKTVATIASMCNNFSNAMDIIRGNYLYSGNTFGGMLLQSLSRSTWERAQQYAGTTLAHARNGFSRVDVEYFHGATVVNKSNSKEYEGVTMGNTINGWNIHNNNDAMLYHEYGHVIQSRYWGPFYLPFVGIQSAAAAGKDNRATSEIKANRYSRNYFGADVWEQTAGAVKDEYGNPRYPIY